MDNIQNDSILFKTTINALVKTFDVEEIVETGTYLGLGSTKIFAETGLPVTTIECNYDYLNIALRNRPEGNVTLKYGLSLQKYQIEYILEKDKTLEEENAKNLRCLALDNNGKYLREFYTNEIFNNLKEPYDEDLLVKCINPNKTQLIFLDSSGAIGLEECRHVLFSEVGTNTILVLDDVNHYKHFRSVKYIKNLNINFNYSPDLRFGWCIL
jgi:hypothetical protein